MLNLFNLFSKRRKRGPAAPALPAETPPASGPPPRVNLAPNPAPLNEAPPVSGAEPDETIRVLRSEILREHVEAGDKQASAATLGHIADMLTKSRRFEEALCIRSEEELPYY